MPRALVLQVLAEGKNTPGILEAERSVQQGKEVGAEAQRFVVTVAAVGERETLFLRGGDMVPACLPVERDRQPRNCVEQGTSVREEELPVFG